MLWGETHIERGSDERQPDSPLVSLLKIAGVVIAVAAVVVFSIYAPEWM